MVTNGNTVLESALGACPISRLETCTSSQFESMDHTAMTAEQPYDIIVLDNFAPEEFPKCRYLVFGSPPGGIDASVSGDSENQFIMDWRQNHAVMQYVNLDNLFVGKCRNLTLPRDADVLAEFSDWPAIGLLRRKGSVFLLVSFDVLQSNWPFEPGFVMFCYNATSYLGIQSGQEQKGDVKVGEPIIIDGLNPNVKAKVTGPGMSQEEIQANATGTLRLPSIERVGVYGLEIGNEQARFFSANLLDSNESRIEPASEIVLSGEVVKAQDKGTSRPNVPLWPFLVMFVLVLACVEWVIYNSKVRI